MTKKICICFIIALFISPLAYAGSKKYEYKMISVEYDAVSYIRRAIGKYGNAKDEIEAERIADGHIAVLKALSEMGEQGCEFVGNIDMGVVGQRGQIPLFRREK